MTSLSSEGIHLEIVVTSLCNFAVSPFVHSRGHVMVTWFSRLMTKLVYCTSDQTLTSALCVCVFLQHLEEVAGKEIWLCVGVYIVCNVFFFFLI